jgi:heptosyltransferase-2
MNEEKKILVIQTAFPGDAILTLPFIQELKKRRPEYHIHVLCIPQTEELFEASPSVDLVIPYDKNGKQKSFLSFIKFLKELKSNKYEIVYSPHRSLRSALIAIALSAKDSFGFENSALRYAFKNTVRYEPEAHEVKRNLEFLQVDYNADKWRILPEIEISEETKYKVSSFLSEKKINEFITIAPGSVWETKKYPVEYYINIVDYLLQKNYQIVLIGGKQDRDLCEQLKQNDQKNVHITAGDFSFIDTIELLKHTTLLICNDSAPTHLGMCANISVLTIYCSTVPEFGFYPYNERSEHISYDELFCKPCGIHGFSVCPLNHFNCAKLLYPNMVIEKAEKMILNAK